jgi:hypothetical protein
LGGSDILFTDNFNRDQALIKKEVKWVNTGKIKIVEQNHVFLTLVYRRFGSFKIYEEKKQL